MSKIVFNKKLLFYHGRSHLFRFLSFYSRCCSNRVYKTMRSNWRKAFEKNKAKTERERFLVACLHKTSALTEIRAGPMFASPSQNHGFGEWRSKVFRRVVILRLWRKAVQWGQWMKRVSPLCWEAASLIERTRALCSKNENLAASAARTRI